MFLIPEEILKNLVCDDCKKYLSVGPVKVYPNKHILCGRCSKDNDNGVESLYGNIVQRGLFRCINRYDGCNQFLLYSEVSAHEANCKSELYNCPCCYLLPKMPAFLLVNHFQKHHKESVLGNTNILISVDRCNVDKKYLYIKEDFLFIICVTLNSGHIVLNTYYIGNVSLSREITQRFILSSTDGSLERHDTGKRPCYTFEDSNFNDGFKVDCKIKKCLLNVHIDIDTKKADKLILLPTSYTNTVVNTEHHNMDSLDTSENKLYLNEEFKKMWSSQYTLGFSENFLLNINHKVINYCSFCQNKFNFFSKNQSVYKCTKCSSDFDRFICSKCYHFGIKKCDNGKDYTFAPEETAVFQCVEYFCKWNCGEKFFSWDLRKHENNCNFQVDVICPVKKCQWKGKRFELPGHVKIHNRITFHEKYSVWLDYVVKRKLYCYDEMIVPVLNYFVNIKWKRIDNKYIFSMYMKNCKNKIPVAVVNIKENINIFTDIFVLDVNSNPSLLIVLRDI